MTLWKLARSPRWLAYLAAAIAFALVCCGLAWWQLARRAEALASIARVQANYDAAPVPLAQALPQLDSYALSQEWLPVQLTGTYLVDEQLLARNRPRNGNPGFEVLTPLRLDDGSVFIVDRGWLPTGNSQDSPDVVPAPPSGSVTVVARLKGSEPDLAGRSDVPGQVASIQLARIAQLLDEPSYTGAYGLVVSETPAVSTMPLPNLAPDLDEGPHLSYALQWYAFALMGFGVYAYGLRQDHRRRLEAEAEAEEGAESALAAEAAEPGAESPQLVPSSGGAGAAPGPAPAPARASRRRSDAEIEDEILDAAER